jgi:hypothetical protein
MTEPAMETQEVSYADKASRKAFRREEKSREP